MPRSTSLRHKQKNTVILAPPPSSDGQMKEKYGQSEVPVGKDSTMSMTSRKSPASKKTPRSQKENPSAMLESPRGNKKKTSRDKSTTSRPTVRDVKLSRIPAPDSTIIEKGYNVSLRKSRREISGKLSLPIRTDCVDMVLNLSTGYSPNTMSNSWFSARMLTPSKRKNSRRTSSTSVITSSLNTMERKRPNIDPKESVLRQRKIRLRVEGKLKKEMKRALFAVYFLYNKAVELENLGEKVSIKNFRSKLLNDSPTNILPRKTQKEMNKVPYDIRDGAIRDFCDAYKTQMKLVKEKKRKHFTMKFRKKKSDQTFVINSKHFKVKKEGIFCFPRKWGKEPLLTYSEEIPLVEKKGKLCIGHDCRVTITRDNKFYLIVPIDVEIRTKDGVSICSLDPGVRIFQTVYDTEGNSLFIGEKDIEKIDHLGNIANRMRNGIKRKWKRKKRVFEKVTTKKEKTGLRKAAYKVETKIKNMISDFHRKTAKFLCETYDHVIIPEFRTQNMVRKRKRCICKTTARKMMHWSHFSFRELLRAKGAVTGTNVIVGTEEYTSKTCGNCFFVNEKLGGDKIFTCPQCNASFHRDVNGARNIMILNWKKLPDRISNLTILGRPTSKRNRQI